MSKLRDQQYDTLINGFKDRRDYKKKYRVKRTSTRLKDVGRCKQCGGKVSMPCIACSEKWSLGPIECSIQVFTEHYSILAKIKKEILLDFSRDNDCTVGSLRYYFIPQSLRRVFEAWLNDRKNQCTQ